MVDCNMHGVELGEIVISMQIGGPFIPAEFFVKAMREVQAKASLVAVGIEEFTAADIFVLKMAGRFKDNDFGGKATVLPDDIMEIMHPGWLKRRAEETVNAG